MVIGAATSFLSPVGHKANVLVFGPGGYRFFDYARVGALLTLILLLVSMIMLPLDLAAISVMHSKQAPACVTLCIAPCGALVVLHWLTGIGLTGACADSSCGSRGVSRRAFLFSALLGYHTGGLGGRIRHCPERSTACIDESAFSAG